MKEELDNWKVHLDKLCELSNKQLEEHATKAIIALINKKSWKVTSKLLFKNWKTNTYPKLIENLDLKTELDRLSAIKFIHIFFVSLSFYRHSIEKQDKELHSEYRIAKKRLKDLEDVNNLIKTLAKRLKTEQIFLNYYSNFFDQNFDVQDLKKIDPSTIDRLAKDKNYLGKMSDKYIEFEKSESRTPTVLEKFSKDLETLSQLLDPIFFHNLHLSNYKYFYLSELKWYVTHHLVQMFKNDAPKENNQSSPWKFISDYFEVFYTVATLKEDFPPDFNPKNLQSKYRSVKKTSKK